MLKLVYANLSLLLSPSLFVVRSQFAMTNQLGLDAGSSEDTCHTRTNEYIQMLCEGLTH